MVSLRERVARLHRGRPGEPCSLRIWVTSDVAIGTSARCEWVVGYGGKRGAEAQVLSQASWPKSLDTPEQAAWCVREVVSEALRALAPTPED